VRLRFFAKESEFDFKDATLDQVNRLEHMFGGIDPKIKTQILKQDMSVRRTKVMAEFCNVDYHTADYYLRKHSFNPEPVVKEIDTRKTWKYNLVWRVVIICIALVIIYFVGIQQLNHYMKVKDKIHWTTSFKPLQDFENEGRPMKLPMIFALVSGIDASMITPYVVRHKNRVDGVPTETQYCAPNDVIEGCWSSAEDALVCADDLSKLYYRNDSSFSWSVCSDRGVARALCPNSYPIMCQNPDAIFGTSHACERQEECAISFLEGPRICPDGRSPANLDEVPTTCTEKIIQISDDDSFDPLNLVLTEDVKIYQYANVLFIMPPNVSLTNANEEYSVSFRVFPNITQEDDISLEYITPDIDILSHADAVSWRDLYTFFYSEALKSGMVQRLPLGGKATQVMNMAVDQYDNGQDVEKPSATTMIQPEYFEWYHAAISIIVGSDLVTINEEVRGVDIVNGLLGPAGGVIALLFNIQNAILIVVLTGITIPFFNRHVFGWKINEFDKDFRRKMIIFNGIYDSQVADADEGIAMLTARSVTWPQNCETNQAGSPRFPLASV